MTDANNNKKPEDETLVINDEWLIRPCDVYEEEYRDCTTVKARLHQYFVFGKPLDCSQWKRDCDNCYRWQERKDVKSGNELIQSEKRRRQERLDAHYNNNVWQRRRTPPENWNVPLPDHIQQEYESSYLNLKSKEMKGEIPVTKDVNDYCVLM